MKGLFRSFLSDEIAIDLGTRNTLVYVKGRGIVLDEPSVLAINSITREVVAVGREAREMLGRTPRDIEAIKPLQGGVVASLWATERMLKHFLDKVRRKWTLPGGRAVIGVPGDSTTVERRAVHQAAQAANLPNVSLVEEVLAAAIGAELPIEEPYGRMVIDIGAGTTDIAVISLAGIVSSSAVRVGGNNLDESVSQHVKRRHKVLIGEATAERVKIALGSAWPVGDDETIEVMGRSLLNGLPKTVEVSSEEIRRAIGEPVSRMIDAVRYALDKTPPELSADIYDRGLVLTGGGSLLRGMVQRLEDETGLQVRRVDEPLAAVVLGTGRML